MNKIVSEREGYRAQEKRDREEERERNATRTVAVVPIVD